MQERRVAGHGFNLASIKAPDRLHDWEFFVHVGSTECFST